MMTNYPKQINRRLLINYKVCKIHKWKNVKKLISAEICSQIGIFLHKKSNFLWFKELIFNLIYPQLQSTISYLMLTMNSLTMNFLQQKINMYIKYIQNMYMIWWIVQWARPGHKRHGIESHLLSTSTGHSHRQTQPFSKIQNRILSAI
jgi:hypothetical protein